MITLFNLVIENYFLFTKKWEKQTEVECCDKFWVFLLCWHLNEQDNSAVFPKGS